MLTNKKFLLDGEWSLTYIENKKFVEANKNVSTIKNVADCGWNTIPAVVPGNFERDFERAGIIGDPYFGTNSIENQKFENLHLIYTRTFEFDEIPDENTVIHFEGIDTVADIYINGKLIASTDNMLIPYEFKDTNIKQGANEIVVHITPAHIAARNYPYEACIHGGRDMIHIRKAPHMIGWDIMPRMLSGGIWRSCWVEQKKPDRIDDVFVYVQDFKPEKNYAALTFFYNISISEDLLTDYRIGIEGVCGDSKFSGNSNRLWHTGGKIQCGISNCKFWWPRNYGEPNLYDIKVTLYYRGEAVYEYSLKYGVRTVKLLRTSTTDKDGSGEFCFYINGKKIFWMGTNWVPVDALHAGDAARLPDILPMLTDIGCNCIRCWGGNVYEDDQLYDFCDANGIMIWQDFSHACSINPQTPEYCEKFKVEVEKIVKRLRNHTSIILWAGDNEVDCCYHWAGGPVNRDPNTNMLTRRVIPDVLLGHDFTRPYLPSSPYVDEEAFRQSNSACGSQGAISEQHLWGPRDYFKGPFYKNTICHFASETGYHGCNSPASLRKFIHEDQLWHWKANPGTDYRFPKPDWIAHCAAADLNGNDGNIYRIPLMSNQVITLFGSEPDNLEDFARASQISQAEAKKYFIERFRVTKWRRTGIIWWNLIDGWPQISDAVVDWYLEKKLAYHYIKRSQQPLCMIFDEPDGDQLPLHIVSDLQYDVSVRYTVTDLTTGRELISSDCVALNNASRRVWLKQMIPDEKHFYIMKWDYTDNNGKNVAGINHYMTNIINIDYHEYLGYMKQAGFASEFTGFDTEI